MSAEKTNSNYKLSFPQASSLTSLLLPTVVILMIVLAFMLGVLWQKVSYLEKGGTVVSDTQQEEKPAAPSDPTKPVEADTLNIPEVTNKDHIRGSKAARLTWIEYSDLECPFCKRIHPDLVKALSEYDGKLRWVYRHFPLTQIHSKAPKEAEAAECAGELGGNDAFWKYVDRIYEVSPTNNGLDPGELPKIASHIGLNQAKFETCLNSGKYATHVSDDYNGGSKAGVSGTPGGFLLDNKGNAWVINGAVPYETIKSVIEAALKG